MRKNQLEEEPLCWYCLQAGQVVEADTVDHRKPHRGDPELFWDTDNLCSCCADCHNTVADAKDRYGIAPGCDENGEPLDENHPWRKDGKG